jgi:hypothetical protein
MIYTVVTEQYKQIAVTSDKDEAFAIYAGHKKAFQLWEQADKYSPANIIKRKY